MDLDKGSADNLKIWKDAMRRLEALIDNTTSESKISYKEIGGYLQKCGIISQKTFQVSTGDKTTRVPKNFVFILKGISKFLHDNKKITSILNSNPNADWETIYKHLRFGDSLVPKPPPLFTLIHPQSPEDSIRMVIEPDDGRFKVRSVGYHVKNEEDESGSIYSSNNSYHICLRALSIEWNWGIESNVKLENDDDCSDNLYKYLKEINADVKFESPVRDQGKLRIRATSGKYRDIFPSGAHVAIAAFIFPRAILRNESHHHFSIFATRTDLCLARKVSDTEFEKVDCGSPRRSRSADEATSHSIEMLLAEIRNGWENGKVVLGTRSVQVIHINPQPTNAVETAR